MTKPYISGYNIKNNLFQDQDNFRNFFLHFPFVKGFLDFEVSKSGEGGKCLKLTLRLLIG